MNLNNLPKHIAIIMDGNGTWAKLRGLPRIAGHKKGSERLIEITKECAKLGIKYLTLFAFSTENWNRPVEEVSYLMSLPEALANRYKDDFMKYNIVFKTIGFRNNVDKKVIDVIGKIEEKTSKNTGLHLIVAFNYGSQDEILNATRIIAHEVKSGLIDVNDISKEYFESKLFTKDIPPVDLLIRTSNQLRISNFLLWQISYSELYFTETLWPDFCLNDLDKAITNYQGRDRRFGGVKG